MDYSQRATMLRTAKTAAAQETRKRETEARTEGLSRKQYWETRVHTEKDAFNYFQLYYPQYTEQMALAMARAITRVVEESKQGGGGGTSSDFARKLVETRKRHHDVTWDVNADIAEEKMKGLVCNQIRHLEELTVSAEAAAAATTAVHDPPHTPANNN